MPSARLLSAERNEVTPVRRMNPSVSVLVPTYRYARFLPVALESVLAQKFEGELEIIVSDDASPDESARVIETFARRDARIRPFIHAKNLGMVANWNFCLREARGEFVQFLFGDDCLASADALATLVTRLSANPRAVLATSPRYEIDANSRPILLRDDWRKPGTFTGSDVIAACLTRTRNLIGEPSVVMFRHNAGQRGFDSHYSQIVDLEMWLHLLTQGDFEFVDRPLAAFRRHEAQQTATNRVHQVDRAETVDLIRTYLPTLTTGAPAVLSPWQAHQVRYRALHGARYIPIEAVRRGGSVAALRADLPAPWFQLCWLNYRFTRQWQKLAERPRKKAAYAAVRDPARIDPFLAQLSSR